MREPLEIEKQLVNTILSIICTIILDRESTMRFQFISQLI